MSPCDSVLMSDGDQRLVTALSLSLQARADQPLSSPGHLTSSCWPRPRTGAQGGPGGPGTGERAETGLSPEIAECTPTARSTGAALWVLSAPCPPASDWWPLVTHCWPHSCLVKHREKHAQQHSCKWPDIIWRHWAAALNEMHFVKGYSNPGNNPEARKNAHVACDLCLFILGLLFWWAQNEPSCEITPCQPWHSLRF